MEEESNQYTPEDKLKAVQTKWTWIVKDLNSKMKTLPDLDKLLGEVFSRRQDLLDYYYSVLTILVKLSKSYKAKYAERYNYYKAGKNGLRYSNDSSIQLQIEADLQDEKETISLINNNINFCKDTLKSIDNLIYGINNKIKIYELINGIKG